MVKILFLDFIGYFSVDKLTYRSLNLAPEG